MGVPKLCAAKCNTAVICSRVTENSSMTSSTVKPASKFSNTVATGIRVSLNTQATLTLPGMLSTAGHCDQSRFAMFLPSLHCSVLRRFLPWFGGGGQRFRKVCLGWGSRLIGNKLSDPRNSAGIEIGFSEAERLDTGGLACGFPGGRECSGTDVALGRLGRQQDTSRLAEEGNQMVLAVRMANP